MEDTQTHDTGVIREKQADEVCDIYDIYGNRTGKTFVRGEPLSDGQYVMVVDVWIVNSKDENLILFFLFLNVLVYILIDPFFLAMSDIVFFFASSVPFGINLFQYYIL